MNELQVFENAEFGKIRMVKIEGKPYAVGVDVARALEYARPADAITAHCKGSVKYRVPTNGGMQEVKAIPQGDIIRLIVGASKQSKNETIKAKAEKFESWIFDEVIPQVLETGSYTAKPMSQLEIMAESIRILQEQDKRLKQIEQTQAEQSQELQGMRNVITLSSAEWRKETTQLLNKIAKNRGDGSYKDVRRESYTLLNERMGVSVDVRLKNARARMYESGYSKTQIDKLNALDVIGQDKKLVEGYMAIVKDMAIKYGVA